MIKKIAKVLMSAALLGFVSHAAQADWEPESSDPILFLNADWTSINLQAELAQLILQTYGYNTESVIGDSQGSYPGIEAGDIHVLMEVWETTGRESFEKSVGTGNTLDLGETGLSAKEDWWYPIYAKEHCPGLPNWEALKDCGEYFATADTAPKGRYLSGAVSWGGLDEERVAALDLPFEVMHAGSDAAMFAELKAAYEREAPIILWVWVPHWVPSLYEGEFVEFPEYEDGCYDDPEWGLNDAAIADCAKPAGWIKKAGWAGGEEKWPCAYEIIENYTIDNDSISDMLVEIDLEGRDIREVAMEWLEENRSVWTPWVACTNG